MPDATTFQVNDLIKIPGKQGVFQIVSIEQREFPRYTRYNEPPRAEIQNVYMLRQVAHGSRRAYEPLKKPGKLREHRWAMIPYPQDEILKELRLYITNLNILFNKTTGRNVDRRDLNEQ